MKYLTIILVILSLCSCNHNEEPPFEVTLPIQEEYIVKSEWISRYDSEKTAICKALDEKLFIVNSPDELPKDDIYGFGEAYTKADFKNYTLLIYYELHPWQVEVYRYRYVRNNTEKRYDWYIGNRIGPEEPNPEKWQFTRYAIAVNKLPENASVMAWRSLISSDWEWE